MIGTLTPFFPNHEWTVKIINKTCDIKKRVPACDAQGNSIRELLIMKNYIFLYSTIKSLMILFLIQRLQIVANFELMQEFQLSHCI